MKAHKLTLLGGPSDHLRVSASLLHEAVGALIEGARLATRFAVDGESIRRGTRPGWLEAACDLDVTGLSPGSVVLELEARTLAEVDPARFRDLQPSLFGETDARLGELTAVDVFGRLLADLVERDVDDVAADRPLLDGCARFVRVAGAGFDGVRLEAIAGRETPLVLRSEQASRIERLRDETPRPQGARVVGRLDTVSASRSDVVLVVADGTRVHARMEAHDLEALRTLLGEEVVVSGVAHFRPSGRFMMLDVEALDRARPEDAVFRRAPVAPRQRLVIDVGERANAAGVSAFFGTWPGDESDAELLELLRAIG